MLIYRGIGQIRLKTEIISRSVCWIGKKSYYIYLTHVLWVFYLPGVLYFICTKLQIKYFPTIYWGIMFIPIIILSCISAYIFEKLAEMLKKILVF